MRILVVEDEHKTLASLRQGLTEGGFSVTAADNGEDGLSFLQFPEYKLGSPACLAPPRGRRRPLGDGRAGGRRPAVPTGHGDVHPVPGQSAGDHQETLTRLSVLAGGRSGMPDQPLQRGEAPP